MRNLLDFIIKYSSAFIFTFLFVICIVLLVTSGRYYSSVWFTSANAFSSQIYKASHGVTGYFNLKSINQSLYESNARLENELLNLKEQLKQYQAELNDTLDRTATKRYDYILAEVLNNSIHRPRNYFTIDKGSEDGIVPGMGVVDQDGIVGIVNVTGPHTARVISLLNVSQHISVRIKDSGAVGSLSWKIGDPGIAYMEEVPKHTKYKVGDEVVTSGYSSAFPAEIPVGKIMGRVKSDNDNFYMLKIKLSSNLDNLNSVRVLKDNFKVEMDSLESYDLQTE